MKSDNIIEALAKEAKVDTTVATSVLTAIGFDADLIKRMSDRNVDLDKLRAAMKAVGSLSV